MGPNYWDCRRAVPGIGTYVAKNRLGFPKKGLRVKPILYLPE